MMRNLQIPNEVEIIDKPEIDYSLAENKEFPANCFDNRFKTILSIDDNRYSEIEEWLNTQTIGIIRIQWYTVIKEKEKWYPFSKGENRMFIAFENTDDALLFKIKFIL